MHLRTRGFVALVLGVGLVAGFQPGPALAVTTLTHNMTGKAEVPGPGDPNGWGKVSISLYPNQHRVCFDLQWRKIKSPMMAHIHIGRQGVAGNIKVTLFSSTKPLPHTIHRVKGCVHHVKEKLVRRIMNRPRLYYVNVHNKDYPGGALRGQLA
jgi:hypothetical protein